MGQKKTKISEQQENINEFIDNSKEKIHKDSIDAQEDSTNEKEVPIANKKKVSKTNVKKVSKTNVKKTLKKEKKEKSEKQKFLSDIDFTSQNAIDKAFKIFYQPNESARIKRNMLAISNILKRFQIKLDIPNYEDIVMEYTKNILSSIDEECVDPSWIGKEPKQFFKTIVQNVSNTTS